MASSGSCRMRGIGGVGKGELVFFRGLLLVSVRRTAGDGITGKGESDMWIMHIAHR